MATAKITTDRQVLALKPQARVYETPIAGARGLSVRTFPSGAKQWVFRYVAKNGTRPRMPLGDYPGLTLAKAVERATALRVEVVSGQDPAAERKADRERARTGDTLDELSEAYFEAAVTGLHGGRKRPKRPSSIAVEKTRYRVHIKSKLGTRRFADLTRSDVKQFMREIASSGMAPDSVASIGRTFSAIMAFAVHEERIGANPVAGLTQPLALKQRERMFSEDALKQLWAALCRPSLEPDEKRKWKKEAGERRAEPAIALALRLAALTLTRRSDVSGARWEEIDQAGKVWTVPADRHKSKRPHVVPIGPEAIKVLEEAAKIGAGANAGLVRRKSGFIFPSPVKQGQPITPHAMTRAVTRICKDLQLPHGSPHDFRRTGPTILTSERGGVRRFIVTKVLGQTAHEGAVVTAVYDRNEYLPDKRFALARWEEIVMEIVAGDTAGANVIPLRQAP